MDFQAAAPEPSVSDEVCEVVLTGPSEEWDASFTSNLVEDGLAACGHIIPRIRSIYRWANAIHDEGECRVAWHTRLNLVPMITDRANREHPYDVPCVIALPILGGGPSYIAWILSETNRSQR